MKTIFILLCAIVLTANAQDSSSVPAIPTNAISKFDLAAAKAFIATNPPPPLFIATWDLTQGMTNMVLTNYSMISTDGIWWQFYRPITNGQTNVSATNLLPMASLICVQVWETVQTIPALATNVSTNATTNTASSSPGH